MLLHLLRAADILNIEVPTGLAGVDAMEAELAMPTPPIVKMTPKPLTERRGTQATQQWGPFSDPVRVVNLLGGRHGERNVPHHNACNLRRVTVTRSERCGKCQVTMRVDKLACQFQCAFCQEVVCITCSSNFAKDGGHPCNFPLGRPKPPQYPPVLLLPPPPAVSDRKVQTLPHSASDSSQGPALAEPGGAQEASSSAMPFLMNYIKNDKNDWHRRQCAAQRKPNLPPADNNYSRSPEVEKMAAAISEWVTTHPASTKQQATEALQAYKLEVCQAFKAGSCSAGQKCPNLHTTGLFDLG